MKFSKNIQLMIGKSSYEESDKWLPVWMHSMDTAKVAVHLIKSRYLSIADIGAISAEMLEKTMRLLALLHDIGKFTPVFQAKIAESLPLFRSKWEHYNIDIEPYILFDNEKEFRHNKTGECILNYSGFTAEFSCLVGAHHGMPFLKKCAQFVIDANPIYFYGKSRNYNFWQEIWREWIDFALSESGFSSIDGIPKLNQRTQILLSGVLIMSDWIASNTGYFPLIDIDEFPQEYDETRLDSALELLDLPDIWYPEHRGVSSSEFEKMFGFPANSVQEAVMRAVNNSLEPGIFILEAPMGVGKTEAALAVAEPLASKCGKSGLFFGLPTQATANGIFPRVVNWADGRSGGYYQTIRLVHKNAGFQPVFSNIPDSIGKAESESNSENEGSLIAHRFFAGRKQSCLADFVIGTVDQALMCALKQKHTMLRHLGFSQKIVVIDECHAYDFYMSKYLDTALSWFSAYNVPVLLLSATLPAKRRAEFVRAYVGKDYIDSEAEMQIAKADSYPLLTWSDGKTIHQEEITYNDEHKTVRIVCINDTDVKTEICKAVNAGGCVGVICNTVKRAQKFAQELSDITEAEVIIFHAQYTMPDRAEKENLLLDKIGKGSNEHTRKGVVVVGTQVMEQSLDIDCDLLITDFCPMDLLLQRIGRLHRHNKLKRKRPESLQKPVCMVLGTDEFNTASEAIYSEWILLRTKACLRAEVTLPDDIAPLVQSTYTDTEPKTEEEIKAKNKYIKNVEDQKSRAGDYMMRELKESKIQNTLHGWLSADLNSADGEASVRDGSSSVEVLLMMERADESISFLPWSGENTVLYKDECPDSSTCCRIAQQRIRLPMILCSNNIGRTLEELDSRNLIFKKWQKSHWLKGELILLLDEEMSAKLNGFKLRYTHEYGLSYERDDVS